MKDRHLRNTSDIVPACGGLEVPFTFNGARWLYVWDKATGDHGYLNLDTDIIHADYKPQPFPVQRIINDFDAVKTIRSGAHPADRSIVGREVRA